MASVQGALAPTCLFSLLSSPLPFPLLLSPFTSQFPGAGRPPEEGPPAAGSRCRAVARQLLSAVLLLGLLLGCPVLLVYLLRSCGPGKQDPGTRPALPRSQAPCVPRLEAPCPRPSSPLALSPRSVPFRVLPPRLSPRRQPDQSLRPAPAGLGPPRRALLCLAPGGRPRLAFAAARSARRPLRLAGVLGSPGPLPGLPEHQRGPLRRLLQLCLWKGQRDQEPLPGSCRGEQAPTAGDTG